MNIITMMMAFIRQIRTRLWRTLTKMIFQRQSEEKITSDQQNWRENNNWSLRGQALASTARMAVSKYQSTFAK